MISIPSTEQTYEALKARIPRIDEAPTSQGRNGQMRISPGSWSSGSPAKAIAKSS